MAGSADLFRRTITLQRIDAGEVAGSVEDDFHHFALRLRHAGGMVTGIEADAIRVPWTTCPGAAIPLRQLVGANLVERASDIGGMIDMRAQCTHMFDLAGLLLALAWRGDPGCRYDAYVRIADTPCAARLDRDGAAVLEWQIADDCIAGAPPVPLGRGFRAWSETLTAMPAEHAFVLRRAVFVAGGRRERLDDVVSPDDLGLPVGACYSFDREIRQSARRVIGTQIDFAGMTGGAPDGWSS